MKNMKKIKKMQKTDLVKNMTAQVSITGLSSRDARVEQGGLEPCQIITLSSSYRRSFLVDTWRLLFVFHSVQFNCILSVRCDAQSGFF